MKIKKSKIKNLIRKHLLKKEIRNLVEVNKSNLLNEEIGDEHSYRIESLLMSIDKKLDTLEEIDISIDYLAGAMTDQSPLSVAAGTAATGRMFGSRRAGGGIGGPKVQEVMTGGTFFGQGLGKAHPSTANAKEVGPIGDLGAPVMDLQDLDEVKDEAREKVMYVLEEYVNNTGDAYELLVLIKNDLEDEMANQGYDETERTLRPELPMRESQKRPKRSS